MADSGCEFKVLYPGGFNCSNRGICEIKNEDFVCNCNENWISVSDFSFSSMDCDIHIGFLKILRIIMTIVSTVVTLYQIYFWYDERTYLSNATKKWIYLLVVQTSCWAAIGYLQLLLKQDFFIGDDIFATLLFSAATAARAISCRELLLLMKSCLDKWQTKLLSISQSSKFLWIEIEEDVAFFFLLTLSIIMMIWASINTNTIIRHMLIDIAIVADIVAGFLQWMKLLVLQFEMNHTIAIAINPKVTGSEGRETLAAVKIIRFRKNIDIVRYGLKLYGFQVLVCLAAIYWPFLRRKLVFITLIQAIYFSAVILPIFLKIVKGLHQPTSEKGDRVVQSAQHGISESLSQAY